MLLEDRLRSLEALRGAAAIVVALRHAEVHVCGVQLGCDLPYPASIAVLVFFTLSGFVLERGIRTTAAGTYAYAMWNAIAFLQRRAARIYPLYWVTLALAGAMLWPMARPLPWPTQLFLLPDAEPLIRIVPAMIVSPAWSLTYEMLFYGAFAAAIASGRRRRVLVLWFVFIALQSAGSTRGAMLSSGFAAFFIGGIAAANFFRSSQAKTARGSAIGWAMLVLAGLLMGDLWFALDGGRLFPDRAVDVWLGAAACMLLVGGLAQLEDSGRLRLGAWALWLGRLSFPLYVTHWLVLQRLQAVGPDWPNAIRVAVLTVCALGVGVAAMFLVDRPTQRALCCLHRWSAGWTSQRSARPVVVTT